MHIRKTNWNQVTIKATPGGSSSCSEGRNAGPMKEPYGCQRKFEGSGGMYLSVYESLEADGEVALWFFGFDWMSAQTPAFLSHPRLEIG